MSHDDVRAELLELRAELAKMQRQIEGLARKG